MPTSHPRPWHRGSLFGDGPRTPLDRNGRARFRFLIHAHRRARRLTRAGLDVGEALVKRQGQDGRCDPSYACLATDADCDKRTVGRALADMRGLGLLRWTRRLVRNGPYVEQTSNAYELTPASAPVTLPLGSTRLGDGQKGRQTRSIEIKIPTPSPAEVREAQAALARRRALLESRWRSEVAKTLSQAESPPSQKKRRVAEAKRPRALRDRAGIGSWSYRGRGGAFVT